MTDTDWIGRNRSGQEAPGDRAVTGLRLVLGDLAADAALPPGLHWLILPEMVAAERLGRDGHPAPGVVLPDLGLPRRMWAGGELRFAAPMPDGPIRRSSTVEAITRKTGSTGPLAFLTMRHVYAGGAAPFLSERQDIVYREPPSGPTPAAALAPDWPDAVSHAVTTDPVLLFRYSALTFNGHRIHYDAPYATGVEGYDGLVVHGPLQATWLLNLATTLLGRLPAVFAYRGLSPLIVGRAARVEAQPTGTGFNLRVRVEGGPVTFQATAE